MSKRTSVPIASVIAALFASQSGHAQTTRYWDNNGNVTGFGSAGGTWTDPTVSQWTTSKRSTVIGTVTSGVSGSSVMMRSSAG